MYFKQASSILGFALFTHVAIAAEPFNWTGFYLGANLGYGWAETTPTSNRIGENYFDINKLAANPEGVVGGGQLGYNWQINRILLGIETDISASGMEDDSSSSTLSPNDNFQETQKINAFGTVRGRLGITFDRVLLYTTAGWAYGNVDYSATTNYLGNSPYDISYRETKSGWTAGGGLEYGMSESLVLRAEYLHIDLNNNDDAAPYYDVQYGWDTKINVFRVGLNYLF